MQRRGDRADRRLDPVLSGLRMTEISERRDQSDRAMAAHANVADVVEEDHPAGIGGVGRCAKERADQHVRAARFVDDRPAPRIVLVAEAVPALRHVTVTQIGATADDYARGLASGVGVDHARRHGWKGHHVGERAAMRDFDYSRRANRPR
jgi:hypothetical protein